MSQTYIINDQDTLKTIASRKLGNPSAWIAIALMNNLKHPYIVPQAIKSQYTDVLSPGDKLILPSSNETLNNAAYFKNQDKAFDNTDFETMIYGTDIGVPDGKLVLTSTQEGTDFFLVHGRENVAQALNNKFKVNRGSFIYYSLYGTKIQSYIGNILDNYSVSLVKAEAIKTVMQDLRVDDIKDIKVAIAESTFDHIAVDMVIDLVGAKQINFQFEVNPAYVSA